MPEEKDRVDWVIPGSGDLPVGKSDDLSAITGNKNEYKVTPTQVDENGKPIRARIDRVVIKDMPAPKNPQK